MMFKMTDIVGDGMPMISVLDIGAMPEGQPRYAPLLEQDLADVIGFEPQPAQRMLLDSEARKSRRYLPHVLGSGAKGYLHITRYPGCTSLYEPDPAVIDIFTNMVASTPEGNFFVKEKVVVQTEKLDDALAEFDNSFAPDFLKIDVQGAELDVLQNGISALDSVLVLETEAEFIPLYKEQPLFCDIQAFLRERGFVLHKFIDVGGRAFRPLRQENPYVPLSQLLWADAVFVRDFCNPDGYADLDLLKAALIAHELYWSIDLAAYYLGILDKRGNTDYQKRYIGALQKEPQLHLMFLNIRQHG